MGENYSFIVSDLDWRRPEIASQLVRNPNRVASISHHCITSTDNRLLTNHPTALPRPLFPPRNLFNPSHPPVTHRPISSFTNLSSYQQTQKLSRKIKINKAIWTNPRLDNRMRLYVSTGSIQSFSTNGSQKWGGWKGGGGEVVGGGVCWWGLEWGSDAKIPDFRVRYYRPQDIVQLGRRYPPPEVHGTR